MSRTTDQHSLVLVGTVGRPHGIRGELRVFTDPLGEGVANASFVTLEQGKERQRFKVERRRERERFWVLKLAKIAHRDLAARWTGAAVYVERGDLPELDEGEFFIHDLLGLEVRDGQQKLLGQVVELFDSGAHDILVYQRSGSRRREMVPLLDEFVHEIDLAAGFVCVTPLFDDEEPDASETP